MSIRDYIETLKEKSEERFNNFSIVEIDSIKEILNKAYLEKPTWLGGDKEFVCLFIDLDKSSKLSFKKHPKVMAKIYDYFTQNIVDVLNHPKIGADYIDIKGDGAFGIFEGDQASFKAFYCALTFKTLFEEKIQPKFSDEKNTVLSCKFGIHKDKILVRRIGIRGDNNEVWAGRLVNNASKLATQSKNLEQNFLNQNQLPILISEKVYKDFEQKKQFGFYHCCNDGNPIPVDTPMWTEFAEPSEETFDDKFYFTRTKWCQNCAEGYMNLIN
jgi:class 3 adenylate cyclase